MHVCAFTLRLQCADGGRITFRRSLSCYPVGSRSSLVLTSNHWVASHCGGNAFISLKKKNNFIDFFIQYTLIVLFFLAQLLQDSPHFPLHQIACSSLSVERTNKQNKWKRQNKTSHTHNQHGVRLCCPAAPEHGAWPGGWLVCMPRRLVLFLSTGIVADGFLVKGELCACFPFSMLGLCLAWALKIPFSCLYTY